MTYTVAATQQLRRRFAARFGAQLAGRMEFRTINGVCARIIRQYERVYDRQAFRLADERELNELVAGLYRSFVQESVTDSELQAMRTAIAYAKNRRLTPDRCEEAAGLPRGFPDVFRAYEGALHTRGWMDYDDQLRYALLILRRCPGLCAGLPQKEALAFASHAAAITVSRMGAQPSLPTVEEVQELLRQRNYTGFDPAALDALK